MSKLGAIPVESHNEIQCYLCNYFKYWMYYAFEALISIQSLFHFQRNNSIFAFAIACNFIYNFEYPEKTFKILQEKRLISVRKNLNL